MKESMKKAKIDQLVPDNLNANKGTEYGTRLIENSIRKFGMGRSILIDKNNRVIAGNKTLENAGAIGLEDVIIVETTGEQIIAVKRTDIDLDSPQGRELALADNATAKANIAWDQENIEQLQSQWNVDTESWGVAKFDDIPDNPGSGERSKVHYWQITITANEKQDITDLFNELRDRGFTCELAEKSSDI